jgi:hypothetical protein
MNCTNLKLTAIDMHRDRSPGVIDIRPILGHDVIFVICPQILDEVNDSKTLKGSYFHNSGCNEMKPGVRSDPRTPPATVSS